MFADTKAVSGFSVDDVARARQFYGETLGLGVSEANGLLTLHIAGERDTLRALPGDRGRDGREGHLPWWGSADRLVQGPGGQHLVSAAGVS